MANGNAADFELTIDQAATLDRTVSYYDEDGALVDLTPYTATFGIYSSRQSAATGGAALLALTQGSGLTNGTTAGTIRIQISAAQSAALNFLSAYYLLKLTAGATVIRLLEGTAKLNRGI